MERRERRDGLKQPERYEGRLERTRKIVGLYRQLWKSKAPFATNVLWVSIDAERPLNAVIRDVLRAIGPLP
jgi:hypothetical protein